MVRPHRSSRLRRRRPLGFIDDSVVVGAHAGLQGVNHGVGALTGRFGVGLILLQCVAHYRWKKTFADIDLVGVAVEPETINPLRCVLQVYELVGLLHMVWYEVGVAPSPSPLRSDGCCPSVDRLLVKSVRSRKLYTKYYIIIRAGEKNCVKKKSAALKLRKKKSMCL